MRNRAKTIWEEIEQYNPLLKFCPFCKSNKVSLRFCGSSGYCVMCKECKSESGNSKSIEEAVGKWNIRAI